MENKSKHNQGVVVPKLLLFSIHLMEFISPYWGMRLAAFFFSKPFRYKRPEREVSIYKEAKKFSYKINKSSKRVACYRWEGSGPKILFVHGWSSRATNFYKIIARFRELNYDVYAYDALAHGASEGLTTNIPEMIDTLEEMMTHWGPVEILVGYSGGAFSSAYVAAHKHSIKKLVLISPFDKVITVFEKYFNMISLGAKASQLMLDYFTKKTGHQVEELSVSQFSKAIKAKTLVIHDKNDREVDVGEGININNSISNSNLLLTEGLGHRRILRDSSVIQSLEFFVLND